ncbi:MAG: FAD-dependent oxidoreductase [Bryobacterales bacterium]
MGSEKAQRFTEFQVHSDVATEPDRTSALYGFDNLLIDHPGYCSMYTLDGGNERLIEALAERVSADVRLGSRALSVEPLRDGAFELVYSADAALERETFDAVLCTLPAPEVPHLHWDDPELAQRVAGHVERHYFPTDYVRVSALFDEPLWREQFCEDYFVASAFDGVTVYDKTPREGSPDYGILSWLIGGAEASRAATSADDALLAEAIESLPQAFDGAERGIRAHEVDRWTGGRA